VLVFQNTSIWLIIAYQGVCVQDVFRMCSGFVQLMFSIIFNIVYIVLLDIAEVMSGAV
jgi:hypothetical protein